MRKFLILLLLVHPVNSQTIEEVMYSNGPYVHLRLTVASGGTEENGIRYNLTPVDTGLDTYGTKFPSKVYSGDSTIAPYVTDLPPNTSVYLHPTFDGVELECTSGTDPIPGVLLCDAADEGFKFTTGSYTATSIPKPTTFTHSFDVAGTFDGITWDTQATATCVDGFTTNFNSLLSTARAANTDDFHVIWIPSGCRARPEKESLTTFDFGSKTGSGTGGGIIAIGCENTSNKVPPFGYAIDIDEWDCAVESNAEDYSQYEMAVVPGEEPYIFGDSGYAFIQGVKFGYPPKEEMGSSVSISSLSWSSGTLTINTSSAHGVTRTTERINVACTTSGIGGEGHFSNFTIVDIDTIEVSNLSNLDVTGASGCNLIQTHGHSITSCTDADPVVCSLGEQHVLSGLSITIDSRSGNDLTLANTPPEYQNGLTRYDDGQWIWVSGTSTCDGIREVTGRTGATVTIADTCGTCGGGSCGSAQVTERVYVQDTNLVNGTSRARKVSDTSIALLDRADPGAPESTGFLTVNFSPPSVLRFFKGQENDRLIFIQSYLNFGTYPFQTTRCLDGLQNDFVLQDSYWYGCSHAQLWDAQAGAKMQYSQLISGRLESFSIMNPENDMQVRNNTFVNTRGFTILVDTNHDQPSRHTIEYNRWWNTNEVLFYLNALDIWYAHRHWIEYKKIIQARIYGNVFGRHGHQHAAAVGSIYLVPSIDNETETSEVRDVEIGYNRWLGGNAGVQTARNDGNRRTNVAHTFWIHHNILGEMSARRYVTPLQSQTNATSFAFWFGPSFNILAENNIVLGSFSANTSIGVIQNRSSMHQWINNIFVVHKPGVNLNYWWGPNGTAAQYPLPESDCSGSPGSSYFNCQVRWIGGGNAYDYSNNVHIGGIEQANTGNSSEISTRKSSTNDVDTITQTEMSTLLSGFTGTGNTSVSGNSFLNRRNVVFEPGTSIRRTDFSAGVGADSFRENQNEFSNYVLSWPVGTTPRATYTPNVDGNCAFQITEATDWNGTREAWQEDVSASAGVQRTLDISGVTGGVTFLVRGKCQNSGTSVHKMGQNGT